MKRFMICANVVNCKMNTNENKRILTLKPDVSSYHDTILKAK